MGQKLKRKTFPVGHGPDDFKCFGPIATVDGEFDNCKMADLGCFNQSGVDSNKAYHASISQSKKNNKWYVYLWWGRTGYKGDFQFIECSSEQDAQYEFVDQVRSKNDKRGEWVTKPGLGRILQAKTGEDCYLVRPLATRDDNSPGLPGAREITSNEVKVITKTTSSKTKVKSKKNVQYDAETIKLMQDLNVATVQYTKANIQGGTIPTQKSIDEGRIVLIEAQKRIAKIGDDLNTQIADQDLRQLTYHLYSRVPKTKRVGAPESEWFLTQSNIFTWQQDLDAFESALSIAQVEIETEDNDDPLAGMNIKMRHLPNKDVKGDFVRKWMPRATRNVHHNIGSLNIINVWEVERNGAKLQFSNRVDEILKDNPVVSERPGQQPENRLDIESNESLKYQKSNVGMLFHGTRTINLPGILREGLRFPKELVGVAISGAMFGPGHYWASDFKKSAGYTSLAGSYWSGGGGAVKGRNAMMFIADVCLGKPHLARGPHGYTSPPTGCHCVYGKSGYSGVQNDEWITFHKGQYQFRYLVEFSVK